MKITFIKDCPPSLHSGWSAYKEGAQADLRAGKILVANGLAREGWEQIVDTEPKPVAKKRTRRPRKKAAVKK